MAAPALRLGGQFVAAQPARADDAVVEGAFGMVAHGAGGEAYALVGDAVGRGGVQVDAGNGAQLDLPAGFLEGFAQGGLKQAFGGLQVPGGLVQHLAAVGLFLDQQEAALVLDDGRYGDMGMPAHGCLLGTEKASIKRNPGRRPGVSASSA